ncbi:MAG: RNA polymerase sigma factor RpoH [Pseudomonadota bacterium]
MSTNIQPLNMLSPGGNLEAYIQSVNTIPLLTPERERELAGRLFYDGDVDAARELVLSHMRFVVYVARSYSGYGLAEADLIQEGNVGLMKAVKRFNPEYGVRLVSFAVHWIKAEIHEFILKNWRIVKVATTKAQRKLFFNLRSSTQRLGWMNDAETRSIADDLGVKPVDVRQMEGRLSSRDESYDATPQDDDDYVSPSRVLEDLESNPALIIEAADESASSLDALASAFEQLDDRSREIVQQRWLNEEKSTLHELAGHYGISAERVRQLEQNALRKLRKQIASQA